jgi:hypothetical protein
MLGKEKIMENLPILKKWKIIQTGGHYIIEGFIYNDIKKRFKDSTLVTTSYIKQLDLEKLEVWTRNTHYKLGNMG